MYTIVGMDERKKKDVKNIIHRSKYSIILVYFKLPQKNRWYAFKYKQIK